MADFTESWESNPRPWQNNLYDITSIVIGEGVTSIGKMAFSNFDMLTSVSIPATVTSIGEEAFASSGSPSEMTVTFAEGSALETIGTRAFFQSKLVSVALPDGVTTIGDFAFAGYTNLASFTFPSSLTTIGERAFQGTALTSVEIPASVTSIGEYAFNYCGSLATVTVYAEPTCALGNEAFYDCSSLAAIYVPSDKVNDFKNATGWSAYESLIDAIPAPATYTVALKEGTEDAENWTITPQEATTTGVAAGTQVSLTYQGTKMVKSIKAVKKAAPTAPAGPVTYTELNGGEVLHVGDIINVPNGEEWELNDGDYISSDYSPYTVVRANITPGEEPGEETITEAEDGDYYVIKSNDVDFPYHFYSEGSLLPATATSDGLSVTYNGISWDYKSYTFTVHEP